MVTEVMAMQIQWTGVNVSTGIGSVSLRGAAGDHRHAGLCGDEMA